MEEKAIPLRIMKCARNQCEAEDVLGVYVCVCVRFVKEVHIDIFASRIHRQRKSLQHLEPSAEYEATFPVKRHSETTSKHTSPKQKLLISREQITFPKAKRPSLCTIDF